MDLRSFAKQIFLAGVESVLPDQLIRLKLKLTDGILSVAGNSFHLANFRNIYVVGAGKATALMAQEIEQILGEHITDGHIVVKYNHTCPLKYLTVTEAGHPLPDKNGIEASRKILQIASKADVQDLVFCLLSGGASALLADFPEESTLEDLIVINELLVKSGADIKEINIVRKHLSKIKGGELAKAIYPATTISLILSDVIGDSLDVVASGPTSDDKSTFRDAITVVEKYNLKEQLPDSLMKYLQNGNNGLIVETPKLGDVIFENVNNFIIGSNSIALAVAAEKAQELGFTTYIITAELDEDFSKVGEFILNSIEKFQHQTTNKPICLLFGGEPTVKVSGNGLGGRNQHLALYCAIKLKGMKGVTLLCAGTDGTDGPTDVAGAIVDWQTVATANSKNIDPLKYLHSADSYQFFKQVGGHIITGSTKTNVMDIMILLLE
jgi:hydroxypyruvate reductase/glycerate 2-kinase